ncbi:MAG TPA: VOC family protein [Rhizomicrobium sp.]
MHASQQHSCAAVAEANDERRSDPLVAASPEDHARPENSPIAKFLQKNPAGGIHHVCYEVDDIYAARDRMREAGATITGTGEPKIGAHGKPVIFLHPKDFVGTLIELEQA